MAEKERKRKRERERKEERARAFFALAAAVVVVFFLLLPLALSLSFVVMISLAIAPSPQVMKIGYFFVVYLESELVVEKRRRTRARSHLDFLSRCTFSFSVFSFRKKRKTFFTYLNSHLLVPLNQWQLLSMGCASSAPAVAADSGESQVREANGVFAALSLSLFSLSRLACATALKKKRSRFVESERDQEKRVPACVERDRDHELRSIKGRGAVAWSLRKSNPEMRWLLFDKKKKVTPLSGDCGDVAVAARRETRVDSRCARTQFPFLVRGC